MFMIYNPITKPHCVLEAEVIGGQALEKKRSWLLNRTASISQILALIT
jgi:hypothetical protein